MTFFIFVFFSFFSSDTCLPTGDHSDSGAASGLVFYWAAYVVCFNAGP